MALTVYDLEYLALTRRTPSFTPPSKCESAQHHEPKSVRILLDGQGCRAHVCRLIETSSWEKVQRQKESDLGEL